MLKESDIKWREVEKNKASRRKGKGTEPWKRATNKDQVRETKSQCILQRRLHTFLQASMICSGIGILCFNLLGWDSISIASLMVHFMLVFWS
jgi:hypothetical protein